jgi:phosphatidylglycerol---prolipoprotein diacylglyceryl transferase
MLAVFLCLYGVVRILVEFFREPDPQIGFFFSFLTMGQLLSSIMIFSGATILSLNRVKKNN